MKVRVKLFAVAKELAGSDALVVELPNNGTIAELQTAVVDSVPALAKIVPHSLWAVGAEYVPADTRLNENSDVAMIPPVSGG